MFTEAQINKHKSQIGKVISQETRDKIRAKCFERGCKPPVLRGVDNPGWKGGPAHCLDCGKELSQRFYTRCKSCSRKGSLNPYYQKVLKENGLIGMTKDIKRSIRNSFKFRQWRSDVFTRDGFTCQECGVKGGKLEAHHILSMAAIIKEYKIQILQQAIDCEKLWDINNGQTLCIDCHSSTESYKGKNNLLLKSIKFSSEN